MVKRKAPDGCLEGSEVSNADINPLLANVIEEREDIGVVACLREAETSVDVVTPLAEPSPNKLTDQEVHAVERFWRLLAEAGYECW